MLCLYDYIHVVPKAPKCNKNWEMSYSFFLILLPPNLFLCVFSISVNATAFHPVTSAENVGVVFVIVKFMCQHDWATGYKVIWLDMISGCFYEGVSRSDLHLSWY